MANGMSRLVTEFLEAETGLTFQQFNTYINSLNKIKEK